MFFLFWCVDFKIKIRIKNIKTLFYILFCYQLFVNLQKVQQSSGYDRLFYTK